MSHKPPSVNRRTEADVRLAAECYEARRAARWLLGDHYEMRIEQWMRLIKLVMERETVPALKAVLVLAKHSDEPMHHLFLTAAAVEVIERG